MTVIAAFRKYWKTALVLLGIGSAVSIVRLLDRGATPLVFCSDLCFTIGMVYLIWGLIHIIGNLDMFASMIWGTKCLMNVVRGKHQTGQHMKDGYLDYLKTRRRHADIPMLMTLACGFFVFSLLASIPSF